MALAALQTEGFGELSSMVIGSLSLSLSLALALALALTLPLFGLSGLLQHLTDVLVRKHSRE